jgi:hypothetical protein
VILHDNAELASSPQRLSSPPESVTLMYDKQERIRAGLLLTVFAALPLVGLASGPAYAPLLFGLAAVSTLWRRDWPPIDRKLALLALLFVAVCAAETPGSVLVSVSAQRTGQMAAIEIGCLLLLAQPVPDRETLERLFPMMLGAIAAGAVLLCADTLLDYRLQRWLTGGAVNAATKYNRGLVAMLLIAWPVMRGLHRMGYRSRAIILGCIVTLSLMVGLSSTGLVALAAGALFWLLAWRLPRAAPWLVGAVATLKALALPLLLRSLADWRPLIAPHVKPSGLHRLEIWDYMSARILERPWTGWGLGAAKAVPIRPEELMRYRYVSPDGVYPHNQWIEAWLETGLPGVLVALALLWLALRRAQSPYALAAIGAALAASVLNFEITTDSWWAALAASALLFRFADQLPTRKM